MPRGIFSRNGHSDPAKSDDRTDASCPPRPRLTEPINIPMPSAMTTLPSNASLASLDVKTYCVARSTAIIDGTTRRLASSVPTESVNEPGVTCIPITHHGARPMTIHPSRLNLGNVLLNGNQPTVLPSLTETIPNPVVDGVQTFLASAPTNDLAITDATATVAGVSAHCRTSSDLHSFAVALAGSFTGGLIVIFIMAGLLFCRMRKAAQRGAEGCREWAGAPGKGNLGAWAKESKE